MITAERQRQWLQYHLVQAQDIVSQDSPAWLARVREHANQAITELPLLDRKQEAWRYTSIESLLNQRYQAASGTSQIADPQALVSALQQQAIDHHLIADLDAYRVVLVNGRVVPHLSHSQALPVGVTLDSLRSVLSSDPDMLATWFGNTANHSENIFTALNTALVNDGVFLHLAAQVELDQPIEIVYLSNGDEGDALMQPRNLIVLEQGARVTLIERFVSSDESRYFHNHLTEIVVGNNATLNHYRVQEESRQAHHLSSVYLSQQAKSLYHGTSLAFGAAWNRTEYHTRFKQQGATCVLNGLSTTGGQQLSDFHLDVRHSVPACVSRERFKSLLYGKGRAVFDGYILVDKQAQHSDAQLTNDNLMLTRDAEVDTKPQLEIYADNVKCSHGTTIGELDPQQMFYLRSRGIDELSARRMLCLGFASDIIDSIHVPALHRDVVGKLSDTLSAAVAVKG